MDENRFWERFQAFCKVKGVTLAEVAKGADVNRSSLFSWRYKMPSKRSLEKIAKYFGVTSEYFLNGSDVKLDMIRTGEEDKHALPKQDRQPARVTEISPSDDIEDVPGQGSRAVDRRFMEFAFALLRLYRSESTESLIEKLDMVPELINAFFDGHGDTVLVDKGWFERFYMLLENRDSHQQPGETNVYQLIGTLHRTAYALNRQWSNYNIKKMNKVIQNYMYLRGVENVTSIEEIDVKSLGKNKFLQRFNDTFYAIAQTGSGDKSWAFCFKVIYDLRSIGNKDFIIRSLEWAHDFSNIEQFCIMFIYAPDYGDDGKLSEVRKMMRNYCQHEMDAFSLNTPLWLVQIHSQTREIISYEPWKSPEEPDVSETSNN